jgi:hypothetical protein
MEELSAARHVLNGFLVNFETNLTKVEAAAEEKGPFWSWGQDIRKKISDAKNLDELVLVHRDIHNLGNAVWRFRMKVHLGL